jgi:hypothetical protein
MLDASLLSSMAEAVDYDETMLRAVLVDMVEQQTKRSESTFKQTCLNMFQNGLNFEWCLRGISARGLTTKLYLIHGLSPL